MRQVRQEAVHSLGSSAVLRVFEDALRTRGGCFEHGTHIPCHRRGFLVRRASENASHLVVRSTGKRVAVASERPVYPRTGQGNGPPELLIDSFADGVNQFLGREDLFEEGELEKKVVVSKMEITATDDKTFRHRTILWMLLLHQIFFSDHEAIIHGGIILSRIFSTFKVAV